MGNNARQTLYCRVNNHMGQEEQTLNHSWQAIHNWLQKFGPSKTDWSKKPACQQNGSEDVKNFAERFVDVWIKLPGLAPNNNPEKEDEIWSECQQLEEIPLKVFTTSFPASGSTLRKYTKNRWVPSGKSAANPTVNRNDENVKRGNWSSKTDYLLLMIGCAVGLGNVWRFPFLAYKNGGGVFLIPYSIMLGLVGIPIFFLESSFGQFASLGPVAVWKSVPMLQGVGVTMVLLIVIANISYACIIGYSLYYQFASFQSPLPWADMLLSVIGCIFMKWEPSLLIQAVLHRTSSLDETGEIVWHLALCLLLAWLMVGAAFLKGIKSSGKVVYFTAIIPYVVVTILLIQGVTLEGASKGIEFYIGSHSDFSKLADAQVWKDAATQIFYSTSVGWGSLITLSSYNKFHNNCYQDTIIVCVVNCATSVFAGFIIFSTLGHMAHVQNKPVSEVAQSGFGLSFIAYPEALAQLPWATLWSILFFFMLLTLGLDTLFASFETVITSLLDQFPEFLRPKRLYLTAGLCLFFYILGLLFVTQDTANEHGAVGDENVERGNWSSKTDYLLSMIGNAVGFGNVWRFPYLAYKNGGGMPQPLIWFSENATLLGKKLTARLEIECESEQQACPSSQRREREREICPSSQESPPERAQVPILPPPLLAESPAVMQKQVQQYPGLCDYQQVGRYTDPRRDNNP
ncbi:sodium- and chloride-dependent neutral and basic amino acid transporter B(0+)-like [Hemiscyllium ocellatum]|uniref:sodium- and chloride-dependent neutral and basic amino acid transporter B(0+)-like n=1 Tax=Hemiscyllium ocellatum TaxID=170820 RepID=UPI0029673565|nr:sodium- and chloride-dependent neutral and basic amino acid transporter B(0+)-like [Hemiscyllium ocellatum]